MLVIFVIVGALVACGGAFFGLLTIPGLENFPTVESLGKKHGESIESEGRRLFEGKPQ
ncbi:MAG: hypothetical protein HKN82_13130 [Akkermansiaceae bacterium]|nr:hypothetical protein [Akkermansiaceae bacterium]